MNVLYSAFIREDSESKGFLKKVVSQCKVFYKYYDNVYLFLSRKNQAVLYKISNKYFYFGIIFGYYFLIYLVKLEQIHLFRQKLVNIQILCNFMKN